ncbi:MAG: DUF1573 domain-containing protein [Aureispira sp.]
MNYSLRILLINLFLISLLFACQNDSPAPSEITEPPTLPSEPEGPIKEEAITEVVPDSAVADTTPMVSRAERPTREPARIVFEKSSYEYDSIQQGDIIEHEFKFKNVGERPLTIKDVKGSCGCTIGSYPFLDIAPNEESSIKARFDSKGKIGPQFTTITVYSNGNPKGDVLSLKGVVLPKDDSTTVPEE